jgi:hygromycin-B 7''-O-kinase
MDSFLSPVEALLPPDHKTCLVHADLNGDHILGRLEAEQWITTGIIDFGDARLGDIYYELVPMHLDLFKCDRHLLSVFLAVYGIEDRQLQDFPRKAMTCTLLQPFNVLVNLRQMLPELDSFKSLDDLANQIWGF